MNTLHTPIFPLAPEDADVERRFGGIGRLYGAGALARFRAAHVCIVGVGGVGSWIVEALARSAIGELTLIDLDHVAESNINRQIQALSSTVGQAKIGALAERVAQINPSCKVHLVEEFIGPDNQQQLLAGKGYDFVIDAIDSVKAKAALIAYCSENGINIITIGSAGGQTDPTRIEVRDLTKTEQEPLLKMVRKRLRSQYNFPRSIKTKFNVDAVFSMEPLTLPENDTSCGIDAGADGVTGLNCAGYGSSIVVTASFGMIAAGHVLNRLAAQANSEVSIDPVHAADALLS